MGKAGKAGAVRDCLLKAGIRPSYPRIRVLDYLVTMKTHPTAEEVFSHLVKEMPTLSRTTVYNTLNLLVGAGLARTLTIEGHEVRYDGTASCHGHFKCRDCGKIYDFAVDMGCVDPPDLVRFLIDEREVYFRGICPDCVEKRLCEGDYVTKCVKKKERNKEKQ